MGYITTTLIDYESLYRQKVISFKTGYRQIEKDDKLPRLSCTLGKSRKSFVFLKNISLYPISRVQKIHLASINNFSNRKYIRAFNSLTMWHNEKGDQLLVFTSTVSQCQKSFMLVIYRRENRLENLRKVLYDLSCLNGFHKQRSAKITATNVIIEWVSKICRHYKTPSYNDRHSSYLLYQSYLISNISNT